MVITDDFGVTQVLTGEQAQVYLQMQEADDDFVILDAARPKKSYIQMLSPVGKSTKNPTRTVLMAWFHMFEAFSSPGILYATLLA